jgi:hypothetical protein
VVVVGRGAGGPNAEIVRGRVAVDVLADDFVDVLRTPDVLAGGLAGAVAGLDLAVAGVVVPLGGVEVAAVGEIGRNPDGVVGGGLSFTRGSACGTTPG